MYGRSSPIGCRCMDLLSRMSSVYGGKNATGFNPAQKVTNPEPIEIFQAAPKTDSQYPSAADIGMNIRTAPGLSAHRLSLLIILYRPRGWSCPARAIKRRLYCYRLKHTKPKLRRHSFSSLTKSGEAHINLALRHI